PQPLRESAQLVLTPGLESRRILDERAQLPEPRLDRRRVTGTLVIGASRSEKIAPRASCLAHELLRARERVDNGELVCRPREPPLLELPAHREQPLPDRRDIFPRRSASPRVCACATVREDPTR